MYSECLTSLYLDMSSAVFLGIKKKNLYIHLDGSQIGIRIENRWKVDSWTKPWGLSCRTHMLPLILEEARCGTIQMNTGTFPAKPKWAVYRISSFSQIPLKTATFPIYYPNWNHNCSELQQQLLVYHQKTDGDQKGDVRQMRRFAPSAQVHPNRYLLNVSHLSFHRLPFCLMDNHSRLCRHFINVTYNTKEQMKWHLLHFFKKVRSECHKRTSLYFK